jgi:hypothetical protein
MNLPRCLRRVVLSISIVGLGVFNSSASAQSFTIGSQFNGTNITFSGFIPPDTMGAIGPNHYVEMINGAYAVYDRAGNLQQRITLDNFWSNNGGVGINSFSFDPRITFDASSGRWFAVAVDSAGGANSGYLVAVSSGSNPTLNGSGASGWSRFRFAADPGTGGSGNAAASTHWADYPTLGLTATSVNIAANMFTVSGGGGSGTVINVVTIPKADLIGGAPTIANRTHFQDVDPNTTGFNNTPINDLSGTITQPGRFLSAFNKGAGVLRVSAIGGTAGAPTAPAAFGPNSGFVTVTSRSGPPLATQNGANDNVNTGDSRFAGSVVHMNGEYWAVHSVSVNSRSALEWYRISATTNNVIESGLISDPTRHFYYGSIALNGLGDVVIGYSGSSDADFISTFVSVGKTSAGVTTFGSPTLTHAGVANYVALDGSGRNRWGDYSSTELDPNNPYSFWTIQEFASGTNQWQTRVTQILVAVPEPATIAMIGLGLAGVGVAIYRRRTNQQTDLDSKIKA